MKNAILIILFSTLFVSCSKEIIDENLSSLSQETIIGTDKEAYFKQINKFPINNSNSFRYKKTETKQDGSILVSLYKEILVSNPSEWEILHDKVKTELESIDKNDKTSINVKLRTAYKFYTHILTKVEFNQKSNEALIYYKNIILENEGVEWDILTSISLRLSSQGITHNNFSSYIIQGAKYDLIKYENLLQELEKEHNDSASNNFSKSYYQEILEDANYALSHLSPQD